MSNAQNTKEIFDWFLKAYNRESPAGSIVNMLDDSQTIDLLRFIKLLNPSLDKVMDFFKDEWGVSLSLAVSAVDQLTKDNYIKIDQNDRKVSIEQKGLDKLFAMEQ